MILGAPRRWSATTVGREPLDGAPWEFADSDPYQTSPSMDALVAEGGEISSNAVSWRPLRDAITEIPRAPRSIERTSSEAMRPASPVPKFVGPYRRAAGFHGPVAAPIHRDRLAA